MIFLCSLKNTLFPFFTLFVVFSSNWINGKAVRILFRLLYISRLKYNERIILSPLKPRKEFSLLSEIKFYTSRANQTKKTRAKRSKLKYS